MQVQRMESAMAPSRAREMVQAAVAYCQEKVNSPKALELVKSGDPSATSYFHYKLAQQVGTFLGHVDDLVNAVHLHPDYPEEQTEAIRTGLPFSLIVCAERHTAALETVIQSLENELCDECRSMLAPVASQYSYLVNISLVDAEDLRQRRGMAAALQSMYTPCLCVWQR